MKRYNVAILKEYPDGDFVLYSDYEKLQAENKRYEKALREIENKKLMWEPDEMVSSLKKIATEALTKGKK